MDSPHISGLLLLIYAYWLLLLLVSWISPFVPFMTRVSSYGKRAPVDSTKPSQTSTFTKIFNSIVFHPAAYQPNGASFRLYYRFATIFHATLLIEWLYSYMNIYGPCMICLSTLDTWLQPAANHFVDSLCNSSPFLCTLISIECHSLPLLFPLIIQIQVCRRFYECLYIHQFSAQLQHIVVTLLALVLYVIVCTTHVIAGKWWKYPMVLSWENILKQEDIGVMSVGIALFIIGSYQQHRAHVILASLRSSKRKMSDPAANTSTETSTSTSAPRYAIPFGGWFEYVSSPHYTGEILIYVSWCVMRRGALSQVLMMLWVASNLTISAHRNHSWYHTTFGKQYPSNRKMIIPFIY